MSDRRVRRNELLALLLSLFALYVLLWSLTGTSPLFSTYDSYVLQAQRWLSGHLDLGQNYSYLEIAEYGGRYYVSFPPIPSVLLLPLCLLFGSSAPDTLLCVAVGALGAVLALKMARLCSQEGYRAVLWALLLTGGSNFLHVGFRGDVWYMAQVCSFTFTLLALYTAMTDELRSGWVSPFALALAFGCRPLQIVYLPLIGLLLWQKLRRNGLGLAAAFQKYWWWALPPLAVGGFLMGLNFARFGDVFQFGHDYLPEFALEKPEGQFSASYLPVNWGRLWALPGFEEGRVAFPIFDGCAFWLFSPIFLSFGYSFLRHLPKALRTPAVVLAPLLILAHFAALCCHATMGGWQFGNRYTVDALPALYCALMLLLRTDRSDPVPLNLPLCLWGAGLNLAGTVAVLNHWL